MINRNNKIYYFKRILPYIARHKMMFFSSIVFMIFVSITKLLDPLILAHIIDKSVKNNDIGDMLLWASFFIIIVIISGLLDYFQTILLAKLGIKIVAQIKKETFEHLLLLPISYFDKNPVGKLIARVESDSEKVKQLFSQFSIMILGNFLFFIGMMIVLLTKNARITLILLIPIPFIMTLVFFVLKYLRKYYKKIRRIYAELSAVLTEYIQGVYIIQLFNKEKKVLNIINLKSKQKKDIEQKTAFFEYSFWSVYSFLIETLFIVFVIILITPKILSGDMSIGILIVFLLYGLRMFEPLLSMSESFNLFQRAFVSLERIFTINDIKTEHSINIINSIPFDSSIKFENVWFKYNDTEWILKDINFTVNKGETIALVGASGSGKTTTIGLLMRYYNINKGKILIDNHNLYSYNINNWRQKTGLVLQDIFLFPGSILENIRIYNNNISRKQVIDTLKNIHGMNLLNKEKGIDFIISERGQNLSVGEKQIISFARAMVFNPEIIILDEATASIDTQTEQKIQLTMEKFLKEKTTIIVAHRLSSIVNADKILLFQNGKILDRGKHNELLQKSGEYKKLVKLQFLNIEDNNVSY